MAPTATKPTATKPVSSEEPYARIAVDRALHEILSAAAYRVGLSGPGVMLRILLSDLETADDVLERYRSQIASV